MTPAAAERPRWERASRGKRMARTLLAVVLLVALAPVAGTATAMENGGRGTPRSVVNTELSSAQRDRIDGLLARMTLDEKIGQLFVVSFNGTTATHATSANATANEAEIGTATIAEAIRRYHVGGVIYFGANVVSPQQVAQLSAALQSAATSSGAKVPLSLSVDQEGGTVWRLNAPASLSPGNMAVGATGDPANAYAAGRIMAQEMRTLGINWNLAPVSDVNTQPYNQADGARSFGDDPSVVPAYVRQAVLGQRAGGVASTLKHFPGLGSTLSNSDVAIAKSSQTAEQFRRRDLPAFAAGIDAGAEAVLTAHLQAPRLVGSNRPTSLSYKVVTGILRNELGFRGAVITDTLQAAALDAIPPARVVVEALRAGNDMLLMPVNLPSAVAAVRQAVQDGRLTRERIDRSVRRILELKAKAGMLDGPWRGSLAMIAGTVGAPDHLAVMSRIANESATLISPRDARVPLRPRGLILVAGPVASTVPQLADALDTLGFTTTTMVTGFGATTDTIDKAVASARSASLVVLQTYDVFGDSGQKALLPALIGTGVPVVVVPIDGPYDAAWASGAAAVVTTYGFTATNLQAVATALVGGITAGRLPVTVPAAGPRPRPVLFPRDWGLRWSAAAR
ncbi:MAG: glycoside hydrolase family 3 protein [Actinomycetales bacterium]|nr:glycoside hydrolase family 3 protein [Actinomycetales bacterium]